MKREAEELEKEEQERKRQRYGAAYSSNFTWHQQHVFDWQQK